MNIFIHILQYINVFNTLTFLFNMRAYLNLVQEIFEQGIEKEDRTGTGTIAIAGYMFEHNMENGFPLITTKKVPFRLVASELEFFIKGLTDKKWLQERNNHIWDEWCNPQRVPYANDSKTKKKMMEERDLGPIYGFQWRHWNADYNGCDVDYFGKGIDQLADCVNVLKNNPDDRGIMVNSWNPSQIPGMALRPCHYNWQVTVIGDKLNLMWDQRSVDTALGLPFNIASYALLLHLLAKEGGLREGKLSGHLKDVHIYKTHIDGLARQLGRQPYPLPKIKTPKFSSIFNWEYKDSEVDGYKSHDAIKFDIAV